MASWFFAKQHLCEWSDYSKGEASVRTTTGPRPALCSAFTLLGVSSTAEERLDCTRRLAAARFAIPEAMRCPRRQPERRERIRLGYLSADFRRHPVAFLIAGVIDHHDRRDFEVVGYSYGPDDGGPMRARLAGSFDRFVDIKQVPHRKAVELIYADAVDILIDLTGYTGPCRPVLLAYRPAPIQATISAFPARWGRSLSTTSSPIKTVAPFEHQPFYTEKIVHLPDCYQVNDDQAGDRRAHRHARRSRAPAKRLRVLLLQQQLEDHTRRVRRLDAAVARGRRQRVVAACRQRRCGHSNLRRGGGGARD